MGHCRHKRDNYIPPTANPVEVKILQGKNQISIHAHLLPAEKTLLHVHLNGEKILWLLWDKIRDELEKLGWFSLPEIPKRPASEDKPVSQRQEALPIADTWMSIPDHRCQSRYRPPLASRPDLRPNCSPGGSERENHPLIASISCAKNMESKSFPIESQISSKSRRINLHDLGFGIIRDIQGIKRDIQALEQGIFQMAE